MKTEEPDDCMRMFEADLEKAIERANQKVIDKLIREENYEEVARLKKLFDEKRP